MERNQTSILRQTIKASRNALSSEDRKSFSAAINEKLLALLDNFKGANIFLCFFPFGSEVDMLPVYKHLLAQGKTLYFPVSDIKNHELHFYQIKDIALDFHKGYYDIMEPDENLPLLEAFDDEIIAFTPGLIFDLNCNRIGYGAGFYDRFFSKHPSITKIGIAFELQIMEKLKTEEYDVPLDYIVTDNRLIKRG